MFYIGMPMILSKSSLNWFDCNMSKGTFKKASWRQFAFFA